MHSPPSLNSDSDLVLKSCSRSRWPTHSAVSGSHWRSDARPGRSFCSHFAAVSVVPSPRVAWMASDVAGTRRWRWVAEAVGKKGARPSYVRSLVHGCRSAYGLRDQPRARGRRGVYQWPGAGPQTGRRRLHAAEVAAAVAAVHVEPPPAGAEAQRGAPHGGSIR